MLALTSDVPLFWLVIAKGMILLLCFMHVRMIQKHVVNYYQLFDYLIDLILMGIFQFLCFVLHRLYQDHKELHRHTEEMAKVLEKFEQDNNRLLEEKEKELQSLRTVLSQVESELETKTKDANAAEANITALRNSFGELINVQGIIVEANRSLQKQLQSSSIKLKDLQYELETKANDVYTAEAKVITRVKQAEVIYLEYDRLLGEQEDELHSCRTRLDNLEIELETKAIECGQLLNEQVLVVQENQSLKNQLQSVKLNQLEYVLESSEANAIALEKQSEEICLYYDGLLAEKVNQLQWLRTKVSNLEFELETKAKDVNAAEANIIVLRNLCGELQIEQGLIVEENQSLKTQLQSSEAKVKQLESELKTTINDIDIVEANADALQEKFEEFVLKYDRLLEENNILKSHLEWETVTQAESQGSNEDY